MKTRAYWTDYHQGERYNGQSQVNKRFVERVRNAQTNPNRNCSRGMEQLDLQKGKLNQGQDGQQPSFAHLPCSHLWQSKCKIHSKVPGAEISKSRERHINVKGVVLGGRRKRQIKILACLFKIRIQKIVKQIFDQLFEVAKPCLDTEIQHNTDRTMY